MLFLIVNIDFPTTVIAQVKQLLMSNNPMWTVAEQTVWHTSPALSLSHPLWRSCILYERRNTRRYFIHASPLNNKCIRLPQDTAMVQWMSDIMKQLGRDYSVWLSSFHIRMFVALLNDCHITWCQSIRQSLYLELFVCFPREMSKTLPLRCEGRTGHKIRNSTNTVFSSPL